MLVILLLAILVSACTPAASKPPATIAAPAPALSTAAPIQSRSITFETPDGATINGQLFGAGATAVIFSVMGDCQEGWSALAQAVAQQGLLALTYPWRACRLNSIDADLLPRFVDDTRGAIQFVRAQGADRLILVGASLGGVASARLAAEAEAVGLVVLAAPDVIPGWGFRISAADLDTAVPKLFMTADNDDTVSAEATRRLYDLAADPKEWQTYPGSAHGTDLLTAGNGVGDQAQQRILQFILAVSRGEPSGHVPAP